MSINRARRVFFVRISILAAVAFGAACGRAPDPAADGPPGATAQARGTADDPAPPKLLQGLGDHHHPITTSVPETQRYFDQGLVLTFGFNHDAAVRSFEEAARRDPRCAMCFWGVALALGPNINAPMGPEAAARAYEAIQKAESLAAGASARERAYIAALATRYAAEPAEDRTALDRAYAEAMRELVTADPDDLDAATLLAEALMDLTPWNYWTDDAQPREDTAEILALLERVLEQNPDHTGANHYYIHAVEEFHPERAVPAADRLGKLAPDAGHLVHMPSHIYWRVGRYDDALEINRRAVAADEAFFAWCRAGAFYRAAYYPHNIHFLWAAASAEGRSDLALPTARKLAAQTSDGLEAFPFLQEFQAVPLFTLVRFGRWDAVLGEPRPDPQMLYVTGIWHYARALARVRRGELASADTELALLRELADSQAARDLVLSGGVATASELLSIGSATVEGELAAARGDSRAAIAALERAVALQDGLPYMEPPPWYVPVRQLLGAALIDAERPGEAERVYRTDLLQHPRNGWSLFGLAQALRTQGRDAEADWAEQGFRNAWERADVELEASRL